MNGVAQWVGVYVINSVWQVPVLAVCTAGLVKATARGGAKLHYRLWVGCLVLAVVLPALPSVGRMPSFRWHRTETASAVKSVDTTPVVSTSEQIAIYTDEIVAPVEKRGVGQVLLWLYGFSLLAGAIKLLGELWATRGVVRRARSMRLPASLAGWMDRLAEAFGVGPVAVYGSAGLRCPATVSWPRPMLLVPEDFAAVPEEDAAAAIGHELAHIRRRDFWANLAFEAASLVAFYHPAMHWIKRRIAESREVVCDEIAAEATAGRAAYAQSLVNLAETAAAPPAAQDLSLGVLGASTLEKRIMRLIDVRLPLARPYRVLAAVGCWVVLAALSAGVVGLNVRPSVVQAAGGGVALWQTAPAGAKAFDVASIKVNRSGSRDMLWGCRGTDGKTLSEVKDHSLSLVGSGDIPIGRCVARNTPLQWIIALAYQIPWDRENQMILGGPDWVSAGLDSPERFDIDAEAGQPATRAQLFQMLQALLADRFQMKIHQEDRELPVYELTVEKKGPRLTKAPADRDCSVVVAGAVPCHNFTGGWDGLTGRSVSMEDFASRLSRYPGRVVVDKTGLDGLYDIKTGEFWMPFPGAPDPGSPTIFNMLQDQFDLQLKAAKAPVKVLIVDSAQQPSAN